MQKSKIKNQIYFLQKFGKIILFSFFAFCFFGIFHTAEAVIVTPGVGFGSTTSSLYNGLVGWWTFDNQDMLNGAVLDKSGNGNTGNLVNMATSTYPTLGKIGQAFKFFSTGNISTNDSVSTTFTTALTDFTVCAWYKTPSGSSAVFQRIIDKSFSTGFWLGHRSGSANEWGGGILQTGSPFGTYVIVPNPINTWHFLCMSRAGTLQTISLDGGSVTTTATVSGSAIDTTALRIGASVVAGTDGYDGSIDDVRIYNRALTASEISQLYKQGQATVGATQNPTSSADSLDSGLVGYWTFNNQDILNGAVRDKSGNGNTGNLVNIATSTFYTQGKLGQAFKFDGVDDYFSTTNTFTPTDTFTASAWTYVDSFTGTYNTVFSTRTYNSGDNFGIWVTNSLRWYIQIFGSGVDVSNSAVSMETKKWYHVVLVKSLVSPYVRFYVNGILVFSSTSDPGTLTSRQLDAGTYSTTFGPLRGKVDDLRVYNRALSASEISQLYKQGQVTVGATQNPKPNQTTLDSGLVGYWTFNSQDMLNGAVRDKSGNGNTGNLVNIATSTFYTQGKFGQGFKFDGVDDYILIPNNMSSFFTNQEASFNIWLKRSEHTAASTGLTGAWYFNDSDANNHYVWTDGGIYDGTFKTIRNTIGQGLLSNRKNWQMITITRKAGANGWNYYQNGNLVQSSDGGTWQFATSNYKIGESRDSTYNFSGVMDEARLYNRVLSASEIRQLYNMGR